MSKLSKNKVIYISVIGFVIILTIILYVNYSKGIQAKEKNEFLDLLITYNISPNGSDISVTRKELEGFIDSIYPENTKVVNKYNEKLSSNKDIIDITPIEMLELHYYSLGINERQKFIEKTTNQKIDISAKGKNILISYNVD